MRSEFYLIRLENSEMPSTFKVWPSNHRELQRTVGLVLSPFTALYRVFPSRCTMDNKAVGTIWRALSKPPQRRQGPKQSYLLLLEWIPAAFGPELASRWVEIFEICDRWFIGRLHLPDSMTMLGQRWPMVVRERWPNIIKRRWPNVILLIGPT